MQCKKYVRARKGILSLLEDVKTHNWPNRPIAGIDLHSKKKKKKKKKKNPGEKVAVIVFSLM
jgi:hypothetical protein